MNTLLLPRFVLLILLAVPAFAQTPVAPAPAKTVSVRFHCLAMNAASIEGLSFMNGKKEVPLSVPTEFLSPTYDYTGPAKLVILRKSSSPSAQSASVYPPGKELLTTLELPANTEELLLLFNQSGDQTLIAAIDYAEKDVPLNGYLFWNLSNRPLAVVLGDTNCIIAAGQRQVLTLKENADYMPLRIFDEYQSTPRQVFASRHLHHPKTRQLVFLSDAPGASDRLSLRIVSQNFFLPKPKAPTTLVTSAR